MATNLIFELEAEKRADIGKGASRRLRHANMIPAVVYGAGEEALSLTMSHDKVSVALSHEAFYSHILTLKVGKKNEKVILKAVQRHPAKTRIQHIDFQRVRADQKLHMHIPLHFIGADKAPGVNEGGIVLHNMSDVEVSCLPANLPENIEVDISELAMNQVLHLTDLKLPKGVELVAFAHGVEGHDLPVVSIHMPQIEEEPIEAVEEGVAEEGAEGGESAAPTESAEGTENKEQE